MRRVALIKSTLKGVSFPFLFCRVAQDAYHGSSNDHKGHRPILRSVIHADGALVLCEHIGKGGVDGNGVNGVQPSRYVGDANQGGFSQEMEPVIVLHR